MERTITRGDPELANPAALGLGGFGLSTILLQLHNLGLIEGTMPIVYGFFWGGMAQIMAALIDARRGDTFGLTAFGSYGLFWIGLGFAFFLQWMGLVKLDPAGMAWLFVCWGIFTGYMTIGTLRASYVLLFVFSSLTVLFFLLAATFFGAIPAVVPGIEGLFCGAAAAYGSAATVVNAKYGRTVFPMGVLPRPAKHS